MAARTAQQTWEANNKVEKVVDDEIYKLDTAAQQQILNQRPWKSDNKHFKDVRMSALALLKIQMHTGSEVKPGQVPLEVMGMLQVVVVFYNSKDSVLHRGCVTTAKPDACILDRHAHVPSACHVWGKIDGHTIIVTDSFALPIPAGMDRGATHVNPGQEAMEYMVQYTELIKDVGKRENVVGWYHSHPGYGCWMSGIDVSTQRTQQQFNDPFLAVVVDPVRSIGAGKVEIGAFRTFPEGYTTNSREASEWQSVPSDRVEDFGVHANCYYQLEMSFYKSSLDARLLDLQWRKYWVNTLAASPLTSNRDYITSQISDVAEKIEKAEGEMGHGRYAGLNLVPADKRKKEEESQLSKATRDTNKVTIEVLHGLSRQVLKAALFNAAPPRQ